MSREVMGCLLEMFQLKKKEEEFASRIKDNPRDYIAQPIISLSRHPTFCPHGVEGRHVRFKTFYTVWRRY